MAPASKSEPGTVDGSKQRRQRRIATVCQKALDVFLVDLFVSARSVARHGRRSIAAAIAVIFGTVALMLAAGFIEWIYKAMREDTIHSGLGHIQVARLGYRQHGMADPFSYVLPEDAPEKKKLESAPHVLIVAPRLNFTGLISFGDSSLSFLGQGLDPDREVGGEGALIIESGEMFSGDNKTDVLLGHGLAANLGAKVGDHVVLLVNTRAGGLSGVEVNVAGTFSTPTKAYDDVAVHVPYALAREILHVHGAHAWVVYLDETRSTSAVFDALRKQLGPTFEMIPWFEAADFYRKTVRLFSKQVLIMKMIIAVVVIFSIANTMMRNVIERTGEIATSMALGLRSTRVLSRFLVEGALLGLVGGLLGVGIAVLLAKGISAIGIPMPPPPGMARGYVGKILITPALARDALFLAAATALVASIYPAWKASRMIIAEALRHGR